MNLRKIRMRFLRKLRILPMLLCVLCFLAGCANRERQASAFVEMADGTGAKIEGDYYTFEDVEGNSYKAPLLSGMPECTYDFSNLKIDEETGYKSYVDEKNSIRAVHGIDVSEFQGENIDWNLVKESGIVFVIIRVGYRAYGEGGELVLDAMFDRNMEGALQAGLKVGVYFFSQAISPAEAVEEAEFVTDHLKPYEISGPVVFDTEEIRWDEARTDGNTRKDFTNYCKVFCETIESAGYEPMIYANMKWMAFELELEELTEYDFWYADYNEVPQCPYDYKIWQYTEEGAVPGIEGNVDLNLWFQEAA